MPINCAATLAFGLPENSRTKLCQNDMEYPIETMLLTVIADSLRTLVWFQTQDGTKGENRPVSLFSLFFGDSDKQDDCDCCGYESGSEFEEARAKILGE